MATERLFTESGIQELLDNNAASPLGRRNAALIMGAVYWGLTPYELSMLSVKDVMGENCELLRIWVIPDHVAFNGERRECHTEDHVIPFFEGYIDWRLANDWGLSSIPAFRGLDAESKFFLNDRGEPYKLLPRKAGSGEYHPRSMNEQLKRMIKKAGLHGATPSSFRDSFVRGLYEEGCGWKGLMAVTGIKQKRTLERKVRPREAELDKVFSNLYSRVRNPVENM
jgi:integrase